MKRRLISPQFKPTPFAGRDWTRRFELFDSITSWVLFLCSVIAIIYAVGLVLQYSIQFLILFFAALLPVVVCLIGRWLARRGRLDLAIYILLTVLVFVLSGVSLMVEGIELIAATFYVILVVMAGILIDFRASFAVAVLSGALYVIVAILGRRPFTAALVLSEGWTIALTSLISLLVFLSTAYLGWLTTRDLRRALQDATYDLVKANEELQEANRLKTHFLARISHELRTPLNSIIGYTDMGLAGMYGELNDAQREGLERVQHSGRQLFRLINDLLDLSRIEAIQLELHEGVFGPEALVQTVIATLEPRAQDKGLILSYEVAPELPRKLLGDEGRLNQILLNLVDNAVKFTSQGSVHISLKPGAVGTWIMRVQDTGRGISEREVPHIFEEFRQGEGAYGQESGGAGLGLAIVRGLIEAMDGTIGVQSRLGVGSTFTVTLPIKLAPQSTEDSSP